VVHRVVKVPMAIEGEPQLVRRPDRMVVRIRVGRGGRSGRWRCGRVESSDLVEVEGVEDVVVVAFDAGGEVLVGEAEDGKPEF
jgi:hypothetical protein